MRPLPLAARSRLAVLPALLLVVAPGPALAEWSPDFGAPPAQGVNSFAWVMVEYDDALIVGGSFTAAGGLTGCGNIAKYTETGWGGRLRSGVNGPVTALATWNGDMYAGGGFTHACIA